jgi:hypothetical protein
MVQLVGGGDQQIRQYEKVQVTLMRCKWRATFRNQSGATGAMSFEKSHCLGETATGPYPSGSDGIDQSLISGSGVRNPDGALQGPFSRQLASSSRRLCATIRGIRAKQVQDQCRFSAGAPTAAHESSVDAGPLTGPLACAGRPIDAQ